MKTILWFLVFISSCVEIYAQLVPTPKYPFEFMSFQTKLPIIKLKYSLFHPLIVDEKTKTILSNFKVTDDYLSLQYYDSTLFKNAKLTMNFSKSDSLLKSVQYTIFRTPDVDANEFEKICDRIWDETKERFGEPLTEKTIPMLGKIRKWEIGQTLFSSMKTEYGFMSLMLSYYIKE
ncbi:MAG: hypothetical protein PHP42_08110 [Bacteroidota bacterium]|nr:hypothetical protein [Bacteroidota bacterium]